MAMRCRTRRRPRKISPNASSIARVAAMSASLARSRSASPFQAAAHGMREVLPERTARPFPRRALLVDDVEELVPIGHRDPGVAHPDVELALVFLVGAQRKLCALGRHPPCVVGFRSHRPAFCCQHPGTFMICLSRLASVRSTTQRDQFLSLRADAPWNEIKPSVFLIKREKGQCRSISFV